MLCNMYNLLVFYVVMNTWAGKFMKKLNVLWPYYHQLINYFSPSPSVIIFPWIPLIYHIKGPKRTISYKVWETLKRINESNKEDENTKVMLDYSMEKCFCSLFNCPAINTYVSLDDDICQSQGFLISAVCGFSVHHLLAIPILLSDERICCNFNC